MFSSKRDFGRLAPSLSAFTLVEVVIVAGLIAVLATIASFSYPPLIAKAENAQCLTNMKALHTALNAYMQDKGQWPQEPADLWENGKNEALEDWWIAALEPYGAPVETWRCPTIFRALQKNDPHQRPKTHYMPSKFGPEQMAPFRWATQPWLIEIGNMHGRGGNICFPDGSIRQMDDFLPPTK